MNNKLTQTECLHRPLMLDCDSHCLIWTALEGLKREGFIGINELKQIEKIQRELEEGILY